jgi:hypothetical protein
MRRATVASRGQSRFLPDTAEGDGDGDDDGDGDGGVRGGSGGGVGGRLGVGEGGGDAYATRSAATGRQAMQALLAAQELEDVRGDDIAVKVANMEVRQGAASKTRRRKPNVLDAISGALSGLRQSSGKACGRVYLVDRNAEMMLLFRRMNVTNLGDERNVFLYASWSSTPPSKVSPASVAVVVSRLVTWPQSGACPCK